MPNKRLVGLTYLTQIQHGEPTFVGAVSGSTARSNATTFTPFTLDAGEFLLLQPDTPCYVGFGKTSADAVAASSNTAGVKLAGDEKFYVLLQDGHAFVAMTPVTGTTVLNVWTVT